MTMPAKFKLDTTDFDFVKHSKQEQAEKDMQKPSEPEVDKMDDHKTNIHKTNIDKNDIHNYKEDIYKINKHANTRVRKRDPQSVIALREALSGKLGDGKEVVVKMTEIAEEIGYTTSWMQFAMKYLGERGEFVFTRYAEGSSRGMKVTRGSA
jgi:hypothetical protein